jgi:hypothetical protein
MLPAFSLTALRVFTKGDRQTASRPLLFAIAVAFLCLTPLSAQDYRATISGLVTDTSGSVVPGADITGTNVASGVASATKTDAKGYYTIPYLTPGQYDITVASTGFKRLLRKGIVVQVADHLDVPLVLEVGEVRATVEVSDTQSLVNTESGDRGSVFDLTNVQNLPLNGRQSYQLMVLTPGLTFNVTNFTVSGGNTGTRGWDNTNAYRINGSRQGNQFLLNGAPISIDGTWQVSPNVEAIQEFKVMTTAYDAQYGRTWGGTINTTIKAGSNQWHGSGFDYFRNSALDANDTEDNAAGNPRGKHIVNDFGGVIGGPIRKNKDFFFFGEESWREIVPQPILVSTIPGSLRPDANGNVNFTGFASIYDPMSAQACTGSTCKSSYIRTMFAGDTIPASRISPVMAKVVNEFPTPTTSPNSLVNNYLLKGNLGRYHFDQPSGRWDHSFGDGDKFSFLAIGQRGQEFKNNSGYPGPGTQGSINSTRASQTYSADYTHIFSPTKVLDVKVAYTRYTQTWFYGNLAADPSPADLGVTLPITPVNSTRNLAPKYSIQNYKDVDVADGYWNTAPQANFAPNITHVIGRHVLHYGAELSKTWFGTAQTGQYNGHFSFSQTGTQLYAQGARAKVRWTVTELRRLC